MGHDVAYVTQRQDVKALCYTSAGQALDDFAADYAVISNATSLHRQGAADLLDAGYRGDVLVEKPAQLGDLDMSAFSRVAVAFNLRFHPCLHSLRTELKNIEVFAVECYVGQHLMTWREGRNLASQYSSHKSQGGGVLRDLSHELDYLTWIFGPITSLTARGGRIADVTVDSDDSWAIIGELQSVPQFSLQLNYLDNVPARSLRVLTSAGTYVVDLINMTIETAEGTCLVPGSTESTYYLMHQAFLAGDAEHLASFEQSQTIDNLVIDIEESAEQRKWVSYS